MNSHPGERFSPGGREAPWFPPLFRTLGLAAPSGPVDPGKYDAAVRFLRRRGVSVLAGRAVLKGDALSCFSAPAADRLADLNALIRAPEVGAIYCLRGGSGAAGLLDGLDWETLKQRRLPVIGYSDITALHAAMFRLKAGIPVSAVMALRLPVEAGKPGFRRHFRRALYCAAGERGPFRKIAELTSCNGAGAIPDSPLIFGNLAVLASLCGTAYSVSGSGKLILLEDIGEEVHRLDRYLTQLLLSGMFRKCRGVIFGDFKRCGRAGERNELIRRFAAKLSAPVFAGLRYGHCAGSLAFAGNEHARVDRSALYLRCPLSAE